MGNIASVHLEQGHVGEFYHNDRSKPTKNSVFKENKVVVDKTAKEALELYKKLLEERTKKYMQRTGRKLQKKTQTLLSVVVNIKETTTLQDLKKLAEKFHEEFGATPLQIALHRDEGHIDPITKEKKINYHAHIMLMGLDKDGFSVKRKIKTRHFRAMQNWAAEILQMERGKSARETRRKRLDTYEYKEAMKLKNKEIIELKKELIKKDEENNNLKITKKQLTEEIKNLRERMKDFNANLTDVKEFTQEDYKALSNIKKMLKVSNLQEALEKLQEFEREIKERIKKRQKALIKKYAEEKGIFTKEEVVKKDVALKIVDVTLKTEGQNIVKLIKQNETLKRENEELKAKVKKMEDGFAELKQTANKLIKARTDYYQSLYKKARAELEGYYRKEGKLFTSLNDREKETEREIERKHKINPNKKYTIDF